MAEQEIISYLSAHLGELIPGVHEVQREAVLPGGKTIDIHAKDAEGRDLFVEFKPEFKKRDLGPLVDYYSAVLNTESKDPKLILVGFRIDPEVRKTLRSLKVDFVPLAHLSIPRELLREWAGDIVRARERIVSPKQAKFLSLLGREGPRVFTTEDIAETLGVSRVHASQVSRRLLSRGWLSRIEEGKYLFIPAEYGYEERYPPMHPFLVGSLLVKPYYFSFATANAYYGFTTQTRSTVYIATTNRKRPLVWQGSKFRFVTMKPNRFFGFHGIQVDGQEAQMALPEKAIVDSFLRPELSGGMPEVAQVLANSQGKINGEVLVNFTFRIRSRSVVHRMGFLLDLLSQHGVKILSDDLRSKLLNAVGRAPVHLVSIRRYGRQGTYHKTWNLYCNLPPEELLSELRVR